MARIFKSLLLGIVLVVAALATAAVGDSEDRGVKSALRGGGAFAYIPSHETELAGAGTFTGKIFDVVTDSFESLGFSVSQGVTKEPGGPPVTLPCRGFIGCYFSGTITTPDPSSQPVYYKYSLVGDGYYGDVLSLDMKTQLVAQRASATATFVLHYTAQQFTNGAVTDEFSGTGAVDLSCTMVARPKTEPDTLIHGTPDCTFTFSGFPDTFPVESVVGTGLGVFLEETFPITSSP